MRTRRRRDTEAGNPATVDDDSAREAIHVCTAGNFTHGSCDEMRLPSESRGRSIGTFLSHTDIARMGTALLQKIAAGILCNGRSADVGTTNRNGTSNIRCFHPIVFQRRHTAVVHCTEVQVEVLRASAAFHPVILARRFASQDVRWCLCAAPHSTVRAFWHLRSRYRDRLFGASEVRFAFSPWIPRESPSPT